jgi:N-acyl-D-aspartate/D-glutamate deacylase
MKKSNKPIKLIIGRFKLTFYSKMIDNPLKMLGKTMGTITDVRGYDKDRAVLTLKIDSDKREEFINYIRKREEELDKQLLVD